MTADELARYASLIGGGGSFLLMLVFVVRVYRAVVLDVRADAVAARADAAAARAETASFAAQLAEARAYAHKLEIELLHYRRDTDGEAQD